MRIRILIALVVAGLSSGCGGGGNSQPAFADLHPVKGVIKRGDQPVTGGVVQFYQEPDQQGFLVNSEVKSDGTFTLSTVRTTDSKGERKPGAPAGTYKVTFTPAFGDQAAGGTVAPIPLSGTVVVKAGENDIPIALPAKK